MTHRGLNELLCAAAVNRRFREILLSNPAQAIEKGYFNHRFALTPEEHSLVTGIQANALDDFAAQVYCWLLAERPSAIMSGRAVEQPESVALC